MPYNTATDQYVVPMSITPDVAGAQHALRDGGTLRIFGDRLVIMAPDGSRSEIAFEDKTAGELGSSRAVVLVHEFVTPLTADDRHEANAADLDRFLSMLLGTPTTPGDRQMIGPVIVPGEPVVNDPARMYFGKAVVRRR